MFDKSFVSLSLLKLTVGTSFRKLGISPLACSLLGFIPAINKMIHFHIWKRLLLFRSNASVMGMDHVTGRLHLMLY